MPKSAAPVKYDERERIAMARMLCVLCMIFVHVPDGASIAAVYTLTTGHFSEFLQGFLVEGPGRASAALLSVVSGYLAATTLLKPGSSVVSLYRRRFKSIVFPMIFWAIVTCLIYFAVSQIRPTFLDEAETPLDYINFVLFLTAMPEGATMHLGFLRDLFVCVLLSPLLLKAVQRAAWLVLPILGLLYLFEHDQALVIILRPLVLFAFALGVYMAHRKVSLNALDHLWPLFSALWVAATLTILLVNSGVLNGIVNFFESLGLVFEEVVLYPFSRLCGSLAIWTLIPLCLGGRIEALSNRYSPYLFAAFCSHYLMLTLLFYSVWSPLFGGRENTVFVVWFLAAPLTAMAVAVLVVSVAVRLAPPLATLITGGRISASAGESVSTPQVERGKQGALLGVWLLVLGASEWVKKRTVAGVKAVVASSRRLLLRRR